MPVSPDGRVAESYRRFSDFAASSHWWEGWLLCVVAAVVGAVLFSHGYLYVPHLFWGCPLAFVLGLLARRHPRMGPLAVGVLLATGLFIGATTGP